MFVVTNPGLRLSGGSRLFIRGVASLTFPRSFFKARIVAPESSREAHVVPNKASLLFSIAAWLSAPVKGRENPRVKNGMDEGDEEIVKVAWDNGMDHVASLDLGCI